MAFSDPAGARAIGRAVNLVLWPNSWFANREIAMSLIVTIDEAQANFKDIVHRLAPGDEIIIYMPPDFDAPLEEFKEYME
ncbi:MAG: hypothetical protein ACKOEO_03860 [Planctomycetaceae bacterium]